MRPTVAYPASIPDPESEVGVALAPRPCQLPEPLLRRKREPDRRELVVVERDGVVEEDQDPVARERARAFRHSAG
jgi:hypothetical protein